MNEGGVRCEFTYFFETRPREVPEIRRFPLSAALSLAKRPGRIELLLQCVNSDADVSCFWWILSLWRCWSILDKNHSCQVFYKIRKTKLRVLSLIIESPTFHSSNWKAWRITHLSLWAMPKSLRIKGRTRTLWNFSMCLRYTLSYLKLLLR